MTTFLCKENSTKTHCANDSGKAGTKRRAAIEKRPRASTLITGGTGFLGSHLVRQLVDDGAKDIRVMATSIPDWLVDLGVETFEGSITKSADVERAVEGIRDVYHLAGKVSREREDAREMYEVHVEGTRLLCDAAKAADVKTIVLASTSGTIAVTEDGEVVPDETYPPPLDIISRWPYYASKAYQEMAALERFTGQRSAAGDHESESAAGSGRRTLKSAISLPLPGLFVQLRAWCSGLPMSLVHPARHTRPRAASVSTTMSAIISARAGRRRSGGRTGCAPSRRPPRRRASPGRSPRSRRPRCSAGVERRHGDLEAVADLAEQADSGTSTPSSPSDAVSDPFRPSLPWISCEEKPSLEVSTRNTRGPCA